MEFRETHVEGVYILDSGVSGPTLVEIGGTHGNEKVGIEIVQQTRLHPPSIERGILYSIEANLKAIERDTRFIDTDLNRSFGKEKRTGYEAERAEQLKPFLADADVVLDFHGTRKKSKPFSCIPQEEISPEAAALIRSLGIDTFVYGSGLLPPNGDHVYVDSFVAEHGGIGITVEGGYCDDTTLLQYFIDRSDEIVNHYLGDGTPLPVTTSSIDCFNAYHNAVAKEGFAWAKEYGNWEPVRKGEVLATSDSGPYVAESDGLILFPKAKPVVGDEVFILVEGPKMLNEVVQRHSSGS